MIHLLNSLLNLKCLVFFKIWRMCLLAAVLFYVSMNLERQANFTIHIDNPISVFSYRLNFELILI